MPVLSQDVHLIPFDRPQPEHVVVAGRGDNPTVRREVNRGDVRQAALARPAQAQYTRLTRLSIPDAHRVVVPPRSNVSSVRRIRDRAHRVATSTYNPVPENLPEGLC